MPTNGATAVHDVLVWIIRRGCFTSRELSQAFLLNSTQRRRLLRRLVRMGAVEQRIQKGYYCVRGEFIEALLVYATGRRLPYLVEEYLAALEV